MGKPTVSYVWNSTFKPVLLYGLCTMNIKSCSNELEKLQTHLVRSGVGIQKYCKNTHVESMGISCIESIDGESSELVRSVFANNS